MGKQEWLRNHNQASHHRHLCRAFISAENRKVEFNNPTLEFTHRTARVTIELKPGTGFIEPWCGRCDNRGFEGELSEKPGINALKAGGVFEKSYDIIVY